MLRVFSICYVVDGLLCWSLLARTKIVGWADGVPHLRQATSLMGATAVLLLAGMVTERSRPGVRALRANGRGRTHGGGGTRLQIPCAPERGESNLVVELVPYD
jgi:hypothetical protein